MTETPAVPPPAPPAPAPVVAAPQRKRYNGLALAALIIVLIAWIALLTISGFFVFELARTAAEGHFGGTLIATLISAGVGLLVSVPLGILAFILALISVFLRNFRKVMAWISLVLSLPFVAVAVLFGLAMMGVLNLGMGG